MNYVPRLTNFAELQDEIAVEVVKNVDNIKDTIARILDDYVEGVLLGHIEEMSMYCSPDFEQDRIKITILFGFWTKELVDGSRTEDVFSKAFYLDELLDDMDDINFASKILKKLRDQLNDMISEIEAA